VRLRLSTYLLGTWVREREVLSLPEAIRRLTSDPADLFGIRDRGRLKPGLAADIANLRSEDRRLFETAVSGATIFRVAASAWSCLRAGSGTRS